MIKAEVTENPALRAEIAGLFAGKSDSLIRCCLDGGMGGCYVDNTDKPESAMLYVGEFCLFAGEPCREMVASPAAPVLTPCADGWAEMIVSTYGDRAKLWTRYAIKKEPDVFDRVRLEGFVAALPEGYTMKLFDRAIYDAAIAEPWSRDFCAVYRDADDFLTHGLGVAVMYGDTLVAGASSYASWSGGVEIEISTQKDHRRLGLACACGAALILECLRRGMYPSWDAYDLRSVALATKLGYHAGEPYTIYSLE